MKHILLFFSLSVPVMAETIYISTSYYERAGTKYRVEQAFKNENCKPLGSARKIFVDMTDELKEIALFDENGKLIQESHPENWGLRAKVFGTFEMQLQAEPCQKKGR